MSAAEMSEFLASTHQVVFARFHQTLDSLVQQQEGAVDALGFIVRLVPLSDGVSRVLHMSLYRLPRT